MPQLETLYKRTRTGAIQFWDIKTYPYDKHDDSPACIIKTSGQLGTDKPLKHEETIKEGKNLGKSNATTPYQQAQLQAESDWKKKRDEGYKTLEDLGIEYLPNSGENSDYKLKRVLGTNDCSVPIYGTLPYCLEEALPQFNTDANGNVKPMLAKDWNGGKKVKYPCYAQPKFDGVRCLMIVDPDERDITFLSRSGKPYTTLSHIAVDVHDWLVNHPEVESLSKFILDGEIYAHGVSFQEVTRLVKKDRDSNIKLHFRAYDIVNDKNQLSRLQEMTEICDAIGSPYIWPTVTLTLNNADEVKHHHDEWVKEGYEGAILRMTHGTYDQGQRSSHLLKVKEFDEAEFEFTHFEWGQREEDLIAVCLTADGNEFRAKMTGDKLSKAVLETQCGELQGSKLTVKHFGWTEDKLPRFPIGKAFRDYE